MIFAFDRVSFPWYYVIYIDEREKLNHVTSKCTYSSLHNICHIVIEEGWYYII